MTTTPIPGGVTPLHHLGVIAVAGADACSFLQGQLTQDFVLLGPDQARLAAYCTPKGRMQASFIGIKRSSEEVLLVMSQDILPATLKRLSMFVLRAKARLRDATAEFRLHGLVDESAAEVMRAQPWQLIRHGEVMVVALYPADGQPRALWVAPASEPTPPGPALPAGSWALGEVRSGVAMITAPVVDAFVPQMLNYESVGGVNFKKGCYPGQEVVARSQFRGTLKRRAYLALCAEALQAGDELFHESDPAQPCGLVVQAAKAADGRWGAIVSMQISAADAGVVSLRSAQGPTLQIEAPPYPLLADI